MKLFSDVPFSEIAAIVTVGGLIILLGRYVKQHFVDDSRRINQILKIVRSTKDSVNDIVAKLGGGKDEK